MTKLSLVCAMLAGTAICQDGPPPLPDFATDVDAQTAEAWRTHIRPDQKDLTFEIIPWLTTLADGIREADEQRKPLLLWVMNGHPLGCT